MIVKVALGALQESRWYEHVTRFALGGAATAMTGLIAKVAGPEIGGLFLAFPAMLCASATLVDSHERRRKREKAMEGTRRGREAAALDAAGAALGSLALLTFALAIYLAIHRGAWTALWLGSLTWAAMASLCWSFFKRSRKPEKPDWEISRIR